MHAYLVVGNNTESVTQKVSDLVGKTSQEHYEFTIQKIEEVRNLNSFLKLTLSKPTAVIITDIHKASLEALNAFLKNLEEPQNNLTYILTARNDDLLPETIISRCQVVRVVSQNKSGTELAEEFMQASISGRLKKIDEIKTRADAINYLQELILGLHIFLTSGKHVLGKIAKIIKTAQISLHNLEANGNVGLQLTNFIVLSDQY